MTSVPSDLPAPVDDDLEAELVRLRRRRRLPLLTGVLLLALAAGGGVLGGVELERHLDSGTAAPTRGAPAPAAARRGGRGFGGGGVAAGSIALVKGTTLYVTDASGNTVKVAAGGAQVSKTVTATVRSLRPGDTVVVRGTPQADGTLKASQITLGGAPGGFGGGGFGFRRGGGSGFGGGGFGGNG